MATAETAEVEQVVKAPGYVLTLTKDEAKAVLDLFACVGGDPKDTRRGLIDSVANALGNAGLDYGNLSDVSRYKRGVYFLTEKEIATGAGRSRWE